MTTTIIVDFTALLLGLIGFHMAFRQRLVRRWWSRIRGQHAGKAARSPDEGDPVHYALIISGMMVLAFGLIIFVFTTVFALLG